MHKCKVSLNESSTKHKNYIKTNFLTLKNYYLLGVTSTHQIKTS